MQFKKKKMQPLCRGSHMSGYMQSGLLDWQKRIERVKPIISLEIEPMRWHNPVCRAAAAGTHVYS